MLYLGQVMGTTRKEWKEVVAQWSISWIWIAAVDRAQNLSELGELLEKFGPIQKEQKREE